VFDRSEAYVGVFTWRYGYVPGRGCGPAADWRESPAHARGQIGLDEAVHEQGRYGWLEVGVRAFLRGQSWTPSEAR
jgi:hypothetical protein